MTEPTLDGAIFKQVTDHGAAELAELYLLQGDLDASYDAMRLYFEKYTGEEMGEEDIVISTSLFRDAIVQYAGCFSRSKKEKAKPTPEAVYGHLTGWEGYFQAIHDLRDAFVAHNFGPQRQHHVVAILQTESSELRFDALGQTFARFGGWGVEEKDNILSFIDIARQHMSNRIRLAEIVIAEMLNRMTSEQLAALPQATLAIPRSEDFRLSRSRYREKSVGRQQPFPKGRLVRKPEPE